MKIENVPIGKIIPYHNNAKVHPEAQVKRLASMISEYKFDVPIVVDGNMVIIKGHGRLEAAKALGLTEAPVIIRDDLTKAQVKAARIADNKISESDWIDNILALEMQELKDMDFDLALTGFEGDGLKRILEILPDVEFKEYDESVADEVKYCECPSCGHKFPK